MIPSRGVDSTAKNIQANWDLTSSATGTVKRRPISLESCKSISPSSNIDFPTDSRRKNDNLNDVVSASCKINKPLKTGGETSEKYDLSQETASGNSSKGNENDELFKGSGRNKINNQPTKKRFFDLKLPESAKKSFASKLKLPNRVSLTLSTRKSSPHNKLSLSQLEQQNNLFIRDGQQQTDNNGSGEPKINKQDEPNNIILGSRKQNASPDVVMEKAESSNPKQKQESSSAGKAETTKSKKSSLIPSFLGGNTKSTNHIKIPAASGSVKKASSTTVVEKLTKTGNKFKELYRDFPSTNEKPATQSKMSLKRNPPPYRPPPTPAQNKQLQSNVERQKRLRVSENDEKNYEEIDPISEENVDDGGKRVVFNDSNSEDIANTEDDVDKSAEHNDLIGEDGMLSKAEYSSNVFKNIPVRQRKCAVSHMENYCLFDPSVDFCNEKELMKKKLAQSRMSDVNSARQTAPMSSKQFQLNAEQEESIEDVTFEDQTVYDVSELDEREKILAHHNYYEIDPDLLLEEDEDESNVAAHEQIQVERNQSAKEKRCQSMASKNRKSKIYSNTLSTSSESTSTSQTSSNSSSTATSSDYPSLFNSVIETTHSSNVESTDDNDSNGYGKVKSTSPNRHAQMNSSQCGDTINQVNVTAVSNESIITISNVVTCGDSNTSTGTTKKKSPQLNRIIRPSSSSSTRNVSLSQQQSNKQQTSSLATKAKSTRINLPFYNKTLQLDPLKSSHSLPHLQNVSTKNQCRRPTSNNEFNFVIDNTTTIQLRRQHSSSQRRPLSGHSDDRDSGFLSPVTPPDTQHPAHITPNVIIKESEQSTKTESTLLNQCDNIQQLIEVSNRNWTRVTCEHCVEERETYSLLRCLIRIGYWDFPFDSTTPIKEHTQHLLRSHPLRRQNK